MIIQPINDTKINNYEPIVYFPPGGSVLPVPVRRSGRISRNQGFPNMRADFQDLRIGSFVMRVACAGRQASMD